MDRLKYVLLAIIFVLIFMLQAVQPGFAQASAAVREKAPAKKVVVFILDAISWDDLRSANVPNLKHMIDHGFIGLMNTKTRGMSRVNMESGYFSLGVGVRANAPDLTGQNVYSKNGRLIVNDIEKLKAQIEQDLPNYRAGQFGWMAKRLGLKVALIGNADTNVQHREAALIAMDENGTVPMGYIGSKLLTRDPLFPGKIRTNESVLLREAARFLPQTDILFIDFGDTTRIDEHYDSIDNVFAERAKALARADAFIGKFLRYVDRKNTMVMVIVPNASKTSIAQGNTSLTPVIVSTGTKESGLLISNTTRREAVVANIDFAPTVFHYLTGQKGEFIGEPMEYRNIKDTPTKNSLLTIEKKERKFYNLRWGRFISHGFYVVLVVLSFVFLYVPALARFFRISEDAKRIFVTLALTFPLTVFVTGPLLPFRHFIIESVTILLISVVLSLLLVNLLRRMEYILLFTTLGTSLVLLSYLFWAPSFLLNSPLGFDDVFLGGRYYGINNDAMGILLGSTLMGLFSLNQWTGLSSWVKNLLLLVGPSVVVLSLSPLFGANVGGTIAALSVTVLIALQLINQKPLTWRKVIFVVCLVFIVEVGIAYMDSLFDPPKTHAGKAIRALLTTGFMSKFSELLISKLRLFALITAIPPYNIILAAEYIIFYRLFKKKDMWIGSFEAKYPVLASSMRIFFFGGLIAFLFNDTGVIATAMLYTYFLLPYGILSKN